MANYVFILDLDGTIIGNCIYQAEIYKISLILSKLGVKIKINNIIEDYYKEQSKLIRPYFLYFFKKMREQFQNCHFYIYTASEKKWAEKEISILEKSLNIKFSRPIFTRNDCLLIKSEDGKSNLLKKSVENIKKKIKVKNPEILIIDDNNVYIDNNDKLVLCNSYNYKSFCNYWNYIPMEKITNKIFIDYLNKLISNKTLSPKNNYSNMKQMTQTYKWLYNNCLLINEDNKQYKNDDFWLKITKLIIDNKITSFNSITTTFINKSL